MPAPNWTAQRFESWITQQRGDTEPKKFAPEFCSAVIVRLEAGRDTSPASVQQCAEAWITFTGGQARGARAGAAKRADTYIKAAIALLPEKETLQRARLYRSLGTLHLLANQNSDSVKYFQLAADLLESRRLEMDLERNSAMVELGNGLLSLNRKNEASRQFLQVMSYPWYTVEDARFSQQLRNQYVLAALGLVEARRGNLAALKEIFVVPAAMEEVGPRLDEAIRDAR